MIRKNQLKSLLSEDVDPAVSIYLPTHKAGPAMREDPIRLKNLLRESEKQIPHAPTADKILEPAWSLVGREREWQHMERGLALFLSEGQMQIIKLPIELAEQVVVQPGFYVRPLFKLLDDGQRFYILILDRKDPRLYLCTRDSFDRVARDMVEESFAALVAKTELPAEIGYHSSSTSTAQGGPGAAKFHSHGASPGDYRKVEVDQFVQGIAKALDDALKEETAPLVVAGEPEMLGLFRTHVGYGNTLDEGVVHSGKSGEEAAIYQQALELVMPELNAPRDAVFARLAELRNSNPRQVISNHEEILRDSSAGKVETLLIAGDAELWGRVIADERTKIVSAGADGAVDLIDRMAARTMAGGGAIFVLPRREMPVDAPAVAILRY